MALILMSLHPENGNFEGCTKIVGKMSGLLHIMRLVAVKEIRREADEGDLGPDVADFE